MITLSALLKRLINACIFWGSWRERGWTPPSPVLSTGVWWRESTMTAWITVWPCSCTIEKRSRHRSERLRLHAGLLDVPSHWDIYTSRCNDRATSITRHRTPPILRMDFFSPSLQAGGCAASGARSTSLKMSFSRWYESDELCQTATPPNIQSTFCILNWLIASAIIT